MLRFRRMRTLQKFAALHGSIHNHFNQERTLTSRAILKERRTAALTAWRQLCAARQKPGWGGFRDYFGLSDSAERATSWSHAISPTAIDPLDAGDATLGARPV